jgi:hypothetical protein
MTYSVVLYFDRSTDEFSVTARKTLGARLNEVDPQQGAVSRILVLSGVAEAVAKNQKNITQSTLAGMGFKRVPRALL